MDVISVDKVVSYNYDDIGNRTIAEGKTYTANNLNQYTAIDNFMPQYDADENQTRIETCTGVWDVQYNAENRPVKWTSMGKTIQMAYDRLGRRIYFRLDYNDGNKLIEELCFFTYRDYACIEYIDRDNRTLQSFVWAPFPEHSSPILKFNDCVNNKTFYYMHDAMKNVVSLVNAVDQTSGNYKYSLFGNILSSTLSDRTASYDITVWNRFCFSSEWYDMELGLIYYNYRTYHPSNGRWLSRDPLSTDISNAEKDLDFDYSFVNNNPFDFIDILGLSKDLELPGSRNTARYNPPNPNVRISVPHVDVEGPGGNKITSINFTPDGRLGEGREGYSGNEISKKAKQVIERSFGERARSYFQKGCPPCPSDSQPANGSLAPKTPSVPNVKNGTPNLNPRGRGISPVPRVSNGVGVGGSPRGGGLGGGLRGGGGGGAGCFREGTFVRTPNGLCAIERLNIGDWVLTYDFEEKKIKKNRILDKIEVLTEDIITITTQTSCVIECSYKHLFYTLNGIKRAEQLEVGDMLLHMDGNGNIVPTSIVTINNIDTSPKKVYNIGVEINHNFFVGRDAILTHNQRPTALKMPQLIY